MLPSLDDAAVLAAVQSGATDVIVASAGAEELVTRVTHRDRLECLVAKAPDSPSDSWGDAAGTVTRHLVTLGGAPVTSIAAAVEAVEYCARIRLTRISDDSTLELVVGCSNASARELAGVLAPGVAVTEDLLRDGLRETTNTLAGALKRCLRDAGLGVTLGLPEDVGADALAAADAVWGAKTGGISLTLALQQGRGDRRCLPISELVAGMVLQHDVFDSRGRSVATAGTALTGRTIERLEATLGSEGTVTVTVGGANGAEAEQLARDGFVFFEAV